MTFSPKTGEFLLELSFNNERPWFQQRKEIFEETVNRPFRELAKKTYEVMTDRFPLSGLEVHISRIYRDARRLYGRGPYKDHLWFSIKDRSNGYNGAQFFFEINPHGYSYGMGFWCASASEMNEFRKAVDVNVPRFERMAAEIASMEEFTVGGDEYKKPKGDYGDIVNQWYNRKNVYVICDRDSDETLYSEDLYLVLADAFTKLMPMCEFLNQFGREKL